MTIRIVLVSLLLLDDAIAVESLKARECTFPDLL